MAKPRADLVAIIEDVRSGRLTAADINRMTRERIHGLLSDGLDAGMTPTDVGHALRGFQVQAKASLEPIQQSQPNIIINMPPVVMPDSFTVDVPAPTINVAAPLAPVVNVTTPTPVVNVAPAEAPIVNVAAPDVTVNMPEPEAKAAPLDVQPVYVVNMPEPHDYAVKRDAAGRIAKVEPV